MKNLCVALEVVREEDEEGRTILSSIVPQYVRKHVEEAVRMDGAARRIQNLARSRANFMKWRPRIMRAKKKRVAVRRIQALARGRRVRRKMRGVKKRYLAARRIQTRIRACLARMRVSEVREEKQAATAIQGVARKKKARAEFEKRKRRKQQQAEELQRRDQVQKREGAARAIQRAIRCCLARSRVAELREARDAASLIQRGMRGKAARLKLKERKQQKAAALTIQGRTRQRAAAKTLKDKRAWRDNREQLSAVRLQTKTRQLQGKRKVEKVREGKGARQVATPHPIARLGAAPELLRRGRAVEDPDVPREGGGRHKAGGAAGCDRTPGRHPTELGEGRAWRAEGAQGRGHHAPVQSPAEEGQQGHPGSDREAPK